jgi:hypothetical protein
MLEDKIKEYLDKIFGYYELTEPMDDIAKDIGQIFEKAIKDTSWAGYLELEKENIELKEQLKISREKIIEVLMKLYNQIADEILSIEKQ